MSRGRKTVFMFVKGLDERFFFVVLPFRSMVMLLMKDSRSSALWCVLLVLSRRSPTRSVITIA